MPSASPRGRLGVSGKTKLTVFLGASHSVLNVASQAAMLNYKTQMSHGEEQVK